jgi:CRP-like cAMP-binding protein
MHRASVHAPITDRNVGDSRRNKLLASLPHDDLARLAPLLVCRAFPTGHLLQEPNDPILRVYFLTSGTIALSVGLPDGKSQYTAIIGKEGALGLSAGLGAQHAQARAVVQSPITAFCIPVSQFAAVCATSHAVRKMLVCYGDLLLAQHQRTIVCNSSHYLQARVCRWLLHARDATGSSTLVLTQQFLSEILGAQRTSVNLELGLLHAQGLIEVQRGRIHLREPALLEDRSCCCYGVIGRLSNPGVSDAGGHADPALVER